MAPSVWGLSALWACQADLMGVCAPDRWGPLFSGPCTSDILPTRTPCSIRSNLNVLADTSLLILNPLWFSSGALWASSRVSYVQPQDLSRICFEDVTDLRVQIPVDIWYHKDLPLPQCVWINRFVTFMWFLLSDTSVSSALSLPSSGNQQSHSVPSGLV